MAERQSADVYAALSTAFREAGWLVSLKLRYPPGREPELYIEKLTLETAEEMAMTIEAGLDMRVIKS